MGYSFVRFLAFLCAKLITRVNVEGWENLPRTGSFIATANHIGRLEVFLVYYFLNRKDIILIIAEKYRSSRMWRWFARQVNGIFIDRYNADFTALRAVLKRLEKGEVLIMAPEGTRSKTGCLQQAYPGAAYLASKSGVSVIPIGITGTEDRVVWEGLKHFRKAKVHARIGKPYTIPPLRNRDREAQLEIYTEDIMCRIAALLPEDYRGFYADHPGVQDYLTETQSAIP